MSLIQYELHTFFKFHQLRKVSSADFRTFGYFFYKIEILQQVKTRVGLPDQGRLRITERQDEK